MWLCATLDYKYSIEFYFFIKNNIVAHMKLINEENDLIAINELKQFKYWNSKIS